MKATRFTTLIITLAAIFTVASSSFAAWDARFFPTPNKPHRIREDAQTFYKSDVVVSQIWEAIDERYWAATQSDSTLDPQNAPVRFPDVSLQLAKDQVKAILGAYIDNISYSNNAQLATNRPFNTYSVSNVVAYFNLPTNFFDYTPPRNLMGDTNWANGSAPAYWTNSARYGWEPLRTVITNLRWTAEGGGILKTLQYNEQVYSADDTKQCKGSGNVYNNDGLIEIPFADLTITNYLVNISIYEGYTLWEAFFPQSWAEIINLPIGNHSDFGFGWYGNAIQYGNSAISGHRAAYTRQSSSSPLYATNKTHIAYSYSITDSDGSIYGVPEPGYSLEEALAECGFGTNQPAVYYRGMITQNVYLSDGSQFVFGPVVPIESFECSACDFINNLREDFSRVDFIPDNTFPDYPDKPVDATFISSTALISYEANRQTTFDHIIEWDFTYK